MSNGSDNRVIFHSELKEMTEGPDGGLAFTFRKLITPKKDKSKRLAIVTPWDQNDPDGEAALWPETPMIQRKFEKLVPGESYSVTATGWRDTATWTITTHSDNPVEIMADPAPAPPGSPWAHPSQSGAGQQPPAPPAQQQSGGNGAPWAGGGQAPAPPSPPQGQPQQAPPPPNTQGPPSGSSGTVETLFRSLLDADALVRRFQDERGYRPDDMTQRIAVTLFINRT